MATVETIKVSIIGSDGGPVNINKSDFDPKKHEEYNEAKKPAPKKKPAKK